MFEQEIEMEKKSSTIVPLLLIVVLIVGIVGVALYFVAESRRVLSTTEATPVVLSLLEGQKPAVLHFQTGRINSSVSDKLREPNYRLLEKEGYLKIGKESGSKTPVSLTPQGQAFLAEIAGVKQSKDKDGNNDYIVPLGQRKLVEINKVTMLAPNKAVVEYTWKWEPTKAGDLFDASGPAVKQFNTWDRSLLIEKYGATFYHAGPTKVAVALVKNYYGWKVSTE
ncbi:MAG: transcriptional regulator [Acidobacteriia bacterium]|nr:transcriptional regulator [Terriglobia bacterium]